MMGQMLRRFLAGMAKPVALGLAVVACVGPASSATAPAAEEVEETPPDLAYIREKAQTGSSKAQTLLADFYMGPFMGASS